MGPCVRGHRAGTARSQEGLSSRHRSVVRYLVDTNAISALRQKHRADRNAVDWFEAAAGDEFFVSALSLMEIEIGVRRLERRDAIQGAALRAWKDGALAERFKDSWIPVDLEIAERCAALHVPDPKSPVDALIAATAIVKGLTLVTRNERDFARMPVAIVNPWAS